MDQINELMDFIYKFIDSSISSLFGKYINGSNESFIKIIIAVLVVCFILHIVITIISDKYYDGLFDDDYIDDQNYYDADDSGISFKDTVLKRVSFSKKGYICYFKNYLKLQHDGVYVSNMIDQIDDVELNDDNNLVIYHDGYAETIDGFKISYIAYNYLKDKLLKRNVS